MCSILRSLSLASIFTVGMLGPQLGSAQNPVTHVSENIAKNKVGEFLTELDVNGDGILQQKEIPSTARPYFEKLGMANGMQIREDHTITQWQLMHAGYHQSRFTASASHSSQTPKAVVADPHSQSSMRGFGLRDDQAMLPGFGAQQVSERYNATDLSNALSLIDSYDSNGNRGIDKQEVKTHGLSSGMFAFDFNKDFKANLQELAQYYARARKNSIIASHPRYSVPAPTKRSMPIPAVFKRTRGPDESNEESRKLSLSILTRHDRNRDKRLDETERRDLGIDPAQVDFNRDGLLTHDELDTWLYRNLRAENENLSGSVPVWFIEKDLDSDGQLLMSEFSNDWDGDQLLQFQSFDLNHDGVLTSAEVLQSRFVVGTSFDSLQAKLMPPFSTIISEIEVREDFVVSDLNIQLSITHHTASHLSAYLLGPDGTQIELFAAVGKNESNFDQTILDDEADRPIVKSRPPFRGSYQPSALSKSQTSLSHFKGKNLKGAWQLIIKAERSDQYGVLHRWSLIGKP